MLPHGSSCAAVPGLSTRALEELSWMSSVCWTGSCRHEMFLFKNASLAERKGKGQAKGKTHSLAGDTARFDLGPVSSRRLSGPLVWSLASHPGGGSYE